MVKGPVGVLQSFLSTVLLSIGIGAFLVLVRRILRLPRRLIYDAALVAGGAALILGMHLLSHDLFGFDPWYGLGFELAKHGLELIVMLMIVVAF